MLKLIIRRIWNWRQPAPEFYGYDIKKIADRVHKRLLEMRDSDEPLKALLEIAAEEESEDLGILHLRGAIRMRELIHELPPRQRVVMLDHIDKGLTYKQIARERSMTERVVLRDLTRAYAELRIRSGDDE